MATFGDLDIWNCWIPFFCISTDLSRSEARTSYSPPRNGCGHGRTMSSTWQDIIDALADALQRCIPKYEPEVWNTLFDQPCNNCYDYACDIRTNMFSQPGMAPETSFVPSTPELLVALPPLPPAP